MANYKNANNSAFQQTFAKEAGLQYSTPVDQNQDRPRNVNWLNIGIRVPVKDDQGNDMIVTLPMGVAIDSMKVTPVNGDSTTNGALALRCRNALIKTLQDKFAEMPEGTRVVIKELVVEAYKAPSTKQVAQADLDAERMVSAIFGTPTTKEERDDIPLPTNEDMPF